ncbi:ABC transporter permease, partial [Streptomyces sp. BE20]|nr:ABC transporter permease [Streptomyces sp. BE20]
MSTTTSTTPPARNGGHAPRRSVVSPKILAAVGGQNLSLIGALVVVLALFGILNDNFLSLGNMQVIAEAATITGLLAIVQTVVIICGGLDIS